MYIYIFPLNVICLTNQFLSNECLYAALLGGISDQRINMLISCDAVTGALSPGTAKQVNYFVREHNSRQDFFLKTHN